MMAEEAPIISPLIMEDHILLGGLVFRGLVPKTELCEMLEDLVAMNRSDVDAYCGWLYGCCRWLETTASGEIIVGGRSGKHQYEVCPALIWLAKHGGKMG